MNTYINTYIHANIDTYIHTYMHACMHICKYFCIVIHYFSISMYTCTFRDSVSRCADINAPFRQRGRQVNARTSQCSQGSIVKASTTGSRRQKTRLWHQEKLQAFLREHNFADAFEPSSSWSCFAAWFGAETVYPIHVAARLGRPDILCLDT